MRTIAAVAAAVLVLPVFAQEPPKPGPEHDKLKSLEGTWTTSMNAGGMEFKGTVTFKMELGGLWLAGAMDSELFGQKFGGKSLETYDAAKKKYVSVWVDSMSAAPVLTEGTYDEATKKLTMTGSGPGPDGPATKYKSVTEYKDADTMVMSMHMGDTKEPSFVVTYKRKK